MMPQARESYARLVAQLRIACAGLVLVGVAAGGGATGSAHDLIPGQAREEPNTTFEALTAENCVPCVKDSYAVAALPLASLRSVAFGPTVASIMSRGGEIRLELVRAYPLGKLSQQVLAMRATLLIKTGDGQLLPITMGLVDEEEVKTFATAVGDIAKSSSRRPSEEPSPTRPRWSFTRALCESAQFGSGAMTSHTFRPEISEYCARQPRSRRAAPCSFQSAI